MNTHPANDGDPSWSHDGKWIYFDSARTGAQQVFKIPANGGRAIQVTHDGGFAPLESPVCQDAEALNFSRPKVLAR
jgi:Tol biopolymer transport system component